MASIVSKPRVRLARNELTPAPESASVAQVCPYAVTLVSASGRGALLSLHTLRHANRRDV